MSSSSCPLQHSVVLQYAAVLRQRAAVHKHCISMTALSLLATGRVHVAARHAISSLLTRMHSRTVLLYSMFTVLCTLPLCCC
jgi:hypothetical protein